MADSSVSLPSRLFTPEDHPSQDASRIEGCGCLSAVRLLVFLILHVLVVGAEVFALGFFFINRAIGAFVFLALAFSLSGMICTYAAWHAPTPSLRYTCLPLKERSFIVGSLLTLPFGIFQFVIIILELDSFFKRRAETAVSVHASRRAAFRRARPQLDQFHCKTVSGAFEGLAVSAVILYGLWGSNFPTENPIMSIPPKCPVVVDSWCRTRQFYEDTRQLALPIVTLIALFSTGCCLVELDFAVSRGVRRRMRRRFKYEVVHCVFRITEVISRCTLIIGFMVLTRQRLWWWWVPACFDVFLSLLLVDWFGGCEVTTLVGVVCAIPCTFVDLFRFVDSPYKLRGAHRLSQAFVVRNAFGTVAFPLLYWSNTFDFKDVKEFAFGSDGMHFSDVSYAFRWFVTVGLAFISVPSYWLMHLCLRNDERLDPSTKDIFTACEDGDMTRVMALTTEAHVGIELNIFDIDGRTPLMIVVSRCSSGFQAIAEAEICRLLVEEGALVDLPMFEDKRVWRFFSKPMRRRWTALHLAASLGCVAVFEALLEAERNFGASYAASSAQMSDTRYVDRQGDTPMHVAASAGHVEIVRLLIDELPHWMNLQNKRGQTPFDLATSDQMRRTLQGSDALPQTRMRSWGDAVSPNLRQLAQRMFPARQSRTTTQKWQSVRLPIVRVVPVKESAPCDRGAPGLSSYVMSCGGVALARAFITNEVSLPGLDDSTLGMTHANLISILPGAESMIPSSSVELPFAPAPAEWTAGPSPVDSSLEDLEPIDAQGGSIPSWCAIIDAHHRLGRPLDAAAFQFLDPQSILGHGNFGVVWRAQDRRSGQKLAVKNIRSPEAGGSTADREFEMSNHIRLQPHPCIVTLFQVLCFPIGGLYMIVMELCPDGDLQGRTHRSRNDASANGTPYEPDPSVPGWIGQVFLALEHLHVRVGAILRDLKPANVVVSEHGFAKLTDFGFGRFGAEAANAGWTFGVPPGSPGFIAPELLFGESHGFRADLYSYGVLIWLLLTGGVSYDPTPRPPVGVRTSPSDFTAHTHDWLYLKQCLENPEANEAPPLPENAYELVAKLTQRLHTERPVHAEIRQHPLLQELFLPEVDAPREEVDTWLGNHLESIRESSFDFG